MSFTFNRANKKFIIIIEWPNVFLALEFKFVGAAKIEIER